METQTNTNWQKNTVELMKTLHGYKNPEYNPEANCIEFTTTEDEKTKMMRVLIDENAKTRPIYVKTVENTIEALEEEPEIDECLILGNRITSASRRMIKENPDLDYLTPNIKPHYQVSELAYTIQNKTLNLCKQKCGKKPTKESDCTGHKNGEYTCQIRKLSDDATFHAEMNWNSVLREDFKNLVQLQKELN